MESYMKPGSSEGDTDKNKTKTLKEKIKSEITELMSKAQKVAEEKSKKWVHEYSIDFDTEDEAFIQSKIGDPKKYNFIVKHSERYSLRMLYDYGGLDIDKYLETVTHYININLGNVDVTAYNVDQGEFAIINNDSGLKLGTTNIQQCVAVIIKDDNKTALAHFDRFTTSQSLKDRISNNFDANSNSFEIQLYGAKDTTDSGWGTSMSNIEAVFKGLENYTENVTKTYLPEVWIQVTEKNIIPTKAEIVLNPVTGAISQDTQPNKGASTLPKKNIIPTKAEIVFDPVTGAISQDTQPNKGASTLPIRRSVRQIEYDKQYKDKEIKRSSELKMFNIDHCDDLSKFKEDNKSLFEDKKQSFKENIYREKLFELDEKLWQNGCDGITYQYDMVYTSIIPYYEGYKIFQDSNRSNEISLADFETKYVTSFENKYETKSEAKSEAKSENNYQTKSVISFENKSETNDQKLHFTTTKNKNKSLIADSYRERANSQDTTLLDRLDKNSKENVKNIAPSLKKHVSKSTKSVNYTTVNGSPKVKDKSSKML